MTTRRVPDDEPLAPVEDQHQPSVHGDGTGLEYDEEVVPGETEVDSDELDEDSSADCITAFFGIAARAAASSIACLVADANDDRLASLSDVVDGLLDGGLRDSLPPEVVGAATLCARTLHEIAYRTGRSVADVLVVTGMPDDLAKLRAASEGWWR